MRVERYGLKGHVKELGYVDFKDSFEESVPIVLVEGKRSPFRSLYLPLSDGKKDILLDEQEAKVLMDVLSAFLSNGELPQSLRKDIPED